MSWKRVCDAHEVPPDTVKAFSTAGIALVIVNYGGSYRAMPPICPHMEEPLEESGVVSHCVLTCTKHLWSWDLRTLEKKGEAEKNLQCYDTKVEDGAVFALLDKEIVYEFEDEGKWPTMTSSRDHAAAEAVLPSVEPRCFTVDVQTKTASFSYPCRDDETLLTAGLAAGHELPYECSTGTCGTCHARVATGSVTPGWVEAPGYSKLSLDKGDVLMCQARPLTDCAIRVRSSLSQPVAPALRTLRRTGRVIAMERLTRDVLHFDLALSAPMDFAAGQFVGLRHAGVDGVRAYSMVNYGQGSNTLSFVVKRKPNGRFSDAIFEDAFLDLDLEVVGPLGRATFQPAEQRDFICVAGGSGIAGMMSIVAHAREIGYFETHTGHVFFGVRTRADAFYLARFAEAVKASTGRLRVVIAISDDDDVPLVHPDYPEVRMAKGFVHEVAGIAMQGQWSNEVAFVAGPQPMVDAAIRMLITQGRMKPADIRFDKFS